ncbi:uncharacterized protein LOC119099915 [Pollicipes pollicipes]|uniref:uncharacterized protein LOC119099915 n=1 Tax=Pollicipes pollicipes TaxID=41117 RepID=UPI0018856439|nr:uncharacterized protein LOC119099915 [Pollicipes pollicipes]
MADTGWLSAFDDDLITYRGVFSTSLADLSAVQLTARRRRQVRARVFFFCAVTSLVLLLPAAILVSVAVQLHVRANSPLAVFTYLLFVLAVFGVCYVVGRSLAVCRAAGRGCRPTEASPEARVASPDELDVARATKASRQPQRGSNCCSEASPGNCDNAGSARK